VETSEDFYFALYKCAHYYYYCCLTSFFLIVETCLSCKDIQPDKIVRWCQNGDFCVLYFSASRVQHISDLHSKFTMCGSMVDIQSATAEIRRGKKRKKPQGKNMMSTSATQGGHNETK